MPTADADERRTSELDLALSGLLGHGKLSVLHQLAVTATGLPLDRAAYIAIACIGDEGPIRLSELARRLAVDVSTASRQVAGLEQRLLLERVGDPHDRRSALLHLTERGRDRLDQIRDCRRRLLRRAMTDWSVADVAALVALLERLNVDLGLFVAAQRGSAKTPRSARSGG